MRARLSIVALAALAAYVGGCDGGEVLYIDVGTAQLRVAVRGNPDSQTMILVLHGGPQSDSSMYERGRAATALESRYRIAYLDQRGMGGSQGSVSDPELRVQRWADDAAVVSRALTQRFRPRALWLLGHSWGGMLGTRILLDTDARDRVAGWIEVAGCHDSLAISEEIITMIRARGTAAIAARAPAADSWRALVDDVETVPAPPHGIPEFRRLYGYAARATALVAPEIVSLDGIDGIAHIVFAANESYLAWIPSAVRVAYGLEPDQRVTRTEDRLGEIVVPSLFLYGAQDFVCPPGLGRRAYERVGAARKSYVELPRAGHLLQWDDPDGYATAITAFIDAGGAQP